MGASRRFARTHIKKIIVIRKLGTFGFIIKLYLLVLSLFSAIRLLFFVRENHHINASNNDLWDILHGFFMGLRFDIVVSGYILILPALVLLILDFFKWEGRKVYQFFFWWVFLLFSIAFFIAAADIPYFDQFFSHVNMGAFEWTDSPGFVAKMIFQEPKIYLFLILAILVIVFFYKRLKRIFAQADRVYPKNFLLHGLSSLLFLALMFLFDIIFIMRYSCL